ncbi:PKD domain-containing protein [Haloarchaeobius sp. HRN-SO-5]|uniref:PKD domain-containing protein n=1 Tax=Haloarchaeobius sp. HRN-SO-5 TaxID=3446118 RepID=UPI003EB72DAF
MRSSTRFVVTVAIVAVLWAATPALAGDAGETQAGPNVTIDGPHTAVYNATSTFEAVVTDAEGDVSVTWEFPDGSTATGETATYRFVAEGNRTVTVTVTDATGTTTESLTYDVYRYQRGAGGPNFGAGLAVVGGFVGVGLLAVVCYVFVLPIVMRNL